MNIFEFGRRNPKDVEPDEKMAENIISTPHSANLPDVFADVRNSLAAGRIGEADLELNLDYPKLEALEQAGKLTAAEVELLRREAEALDKEIHREAA